MGNKPNQTQEPTNDVIDEKEFESKLKSLKMNPHFILMGDSVLDNKAWTMNETDVEKQMNEALSQYNKLWKCKNLAVDGNTTQSLIHSLDESNKSNPKRFKSLQKYLKSDSIDLESERAIIILSIGGNDVLGCMYHNNQISKNVVADMQRNEFLKTYERILSIFINECHCDVIIVFCYEPHIRFCKDHKVERNELLKIMSWAANEIFEIAEKYKLPLIDLSRTGNPFNKTHYSLASPIEPNEKMGSFLTNLMLHVLYDFDFESRKERCSKIYFGQNEDENGINIEMNTAKVRKQYSKSKLSLHANPKK